MMATTMTAMTRLARWIIAAFALIVFAAVNGAASAQQQQGQGGGQGGGQGQKVHIASDTAVYGAGGGDVVFAGNVAATIGVWHLSAATVAVKGGQYYAYGNPLYASGVAASGGTVVVNAAFLNYDGGDKVTIGGANNGGKDGGFVRAGWMAIDDGGDITVRAMTITYDLASGDALLIGDALLGRGAEQIRGTRISININTGAMKAEQGRVRAVLDSGQ